MTYTATEWRSVPVFNPILRIVARTSSRAFVGLPLCRNEDWLTVAMRFTGDVFKTVNELSKIPKAIRPFYAWMCSSTKLITSHRKKAEILLAPTIQGRLENERLAEKNGTDYEKPNDMLQWLREIVVPQHRNLEHLSELQLQVSLATIHSTCNAFLGALLDLAAHPECIQPIREEIEAVIAENNGVIDRTVLRNMKKTDSFFKESMRTSPHLRKYITTLSLKSYSYFFVKSVSIARLRKA